MAETSTNKLPRKTVLLMAGVAIATALTVGTVAFYLGSENAKKPPASTDVGPVERSLEPAAIESQLPEGTVSPSDFLASINDGAKTDAKIKIRGLLIGGEDNKYTLADQQPKDGQLRAIRLDFNGSNVDPAPYISAYANTDKLAPIPPSGPITVTIIYVQKKNSEDGFKVVSVEE